MALTNDSSAGQALGWMVAAITLIRLVTLGVYPLTDTTEARYAEIARKMAELGDWVTPWYDYGVPFWGKPPMSTWLSAASFKLLGVSEFAARLPHFLAAVLVAWLMWDWVRQRSAREAVLAIALLSGAALFYVAAGAVMTDMTLAIGTMLAMRGFWLGLHGSDPQRRRERWLPFVGVAVGLLAKGPIALVLICLPITVWSLVTHNVRLAWHRLPWLSGSLMVAVLAFPWYVIAEFRTPGFLDYFLIGEHWQRFMTAGWAGDLYGSAHAFPRGSIWLFALGACLPWTLLLPMLAFGRQRAVATGPMDGGERARRTYLWLWGLTPCVFFTASGNILWTYVLPGLPAMATLAATWLAADGRARRVNRIVAAGVLIIPVALCGLIGSQYVLGTLKTTKPLVQEYLARRGSAERLDFLGARPPYSASFYSQGKAEHVLDATVLFQRLDREPAFLALKPQQLRQLPPELQARLRREGQYSGYELFSVVP